MMNIIKGNNHLSSWGVILLLSASILTPIEALSVSKSVKPSVEKGSERSIQVSDRDVLKDDGISFEYSNEQLMCNRSVLAGEQSPDDDTVACFWNPLDEFPSHLSYSEREVYLHKLLLEVNGFGNTIDEWQRAAHNRNWSARDVALYLLVQENDQSNRDIFLRWVNQPCCDEWSPHHYAQALSAYGLYRLGDSSWLSLLECIALSDIAGERTSADASGLLARLGNGDGFAVIKDLFASEFFSTKKSAIDNLIYFVPLQSQIDSTGNVIDVWELYHEALTAQDEVIRIIAKAQLEEIGTSEALALLREFGLQQ